MGAVHLACVFFAKLFVSHSINRFFKLCSLYNSACIEKMK